MHRMTPMALVMLALAGCQPPASPGASDTGSVATFPMESRDYVYQDLQSNSPADFPHDLGSRFRQVRVSRREGNQVVECKVTDVTQYPIPNAGVRSFIWALEGDRIVVKTASGDPTLDGWPASWTAPTGLATPAPASEIVVRDPLIGPLATTSAVVRSSQMSGLSYAINLGKVFRDCLLVKQTFQTDSAEFKPLSATALSVTERTLAPGAGLLFESTLTQTVVGTSRTYTRNVSELATYSIVLP